MENELHSRTIVITATFTAEPVGDSLLLLFKRLGVATDLKFAPYNQVFQQLLDPDSLTGRNQNGANVCLLRLEDWGVVESHNNGKTPVPDLENIERSAADFVQAISSASARSRVPFVVVICPPSGAARADSRFSDLLADVEELICGELDKLSGVVFVSSNALAAAYPVSEYDDPQGNRLGRIPYTELFFTALGALIARKIYALQTAPRKVIVLDCDQTLWKGVCGEDGPLGIEIDPPRRALQEFLIQQHNSGMLLCVCSKNNEEDVLEVFNQQSEMPLKREHILSWRINWQPKSQNLRSLAAELNLSLDSFIFVDDDSAVCAEVRAHCPEVLTLQLPQDSGKIADFIKNVWAFDRPKQTHEDKQRTQLYRQSLDREQLRTRSVSLQNFLEGLELKIKISPLQSEEISRASQLTQRTNQFNFTTVRLSEQEIEGMCRTGEAECLVVRVTDRFGDYGIVGLMIFKEENEAFLVDAFLLSCRALGRGVEHEMLVRLGEICQERGIDHLSIQFRKTPKNQPALEFIRELGAKNEIEEGDCRYRLAASNASRLRFDVNSGSLDEPSDTIGFDPERRVNSTVVPNTSTQSSALTAIAGELSNPQQILAAVRAETMRLQPVGRSFVGPEDEIESRLKAVWEGVLGLQSISVEDNFFGLGGDSILAVRLLSEVERVFGRHLPLTTLLTAVTIRQIAALLRESDRSQQWSSLVAIQPNGSRPPFYCMHAAGGSVLFYRDLAKHLGLNQPFYGLQARGLNPNQTTHDSIEEMASYYLGEIRAFQPEGPYYLGGSSFGGLVAFEMARQLDKQGQVVGLLALFDTYGPGYSALLPKSSSLSRMIGRVCERVRTERRSLRLLEPRNKIAYLIGKTRKAARRLIRRFAWKKNEIAIRFSAATGRPLPGDIQRNHKAIMQAERNYKPKPYGGRLTLFRATSQSSRIVADATLGWKAWALGGLEVCDIPGFHGVVTVDPHARFLAQKLAPCLTAAQQGYEEKPLASGHDNSPDVQELLSWSSVA